MEALNNGIKKAEHRKWGILVFDCWILDPNGVLKEDVFWF